MDQEHREHASAAAETTRKDQRKPHVVSPQFSLPSLHPADPSSQHVEKRDSFSTEHSSQLSAQRRKKGGKRRQRVPEMRQVTAVECGAACLAMILHYYGRASSLSEVQASCGAGRDGLTALELVKAAHAYGLRVRAVSVKLEDLRYVPFPAIVHWQFNHFVILERWFEPRGGPA